MIDREKVIENYILRYNYKTLYEKYWIRRRLERILRTPEENRRYDYSRTN
jgi:hypothetical protein